MFLLLESARFLNKPDQTMGSKAFWKYLLRSAVQLRSSRRWAGFLLQDSAYRELLSLQPRLLLKPHRPYLRKDADATQRTHWLMDHYRWVRENWPASFALNLFQQKQCELAQLACDGTRDYRLVLRPTCKFDREGELLISLETQGLPLAVVSFSIVRHGLDWVASVGCMQGASPELGRDAVKAATADLHGLRPKQAVLTALYAMVRGYGVERIHAVGNGDHVHMARWRSRNKIAADYDGFWREMGGEPLGDGFLLPRRLARKSGDEIPSRKRAQYRRRQALEDSMIGQIRAALPNCETVPVYQTRPTPLNSTCLVDAKAVNQSGGYLPFKIAA